MIRTLGPQEGTHCRHLYGRWQPKGREGFNSVPPPVITLSQGEITENVVIARTEDWMYSCGRTISIRRQQQSAVEPLEK